MYITKNLFYSSKSRPNLPPPKPLKTSLQETRTSWEPAVSKYSHREEFSIFCQLATSNFSHFQDFQHSERHLIEQRRQKPSSLILAPNATSRKLQGHRMTGFHIASRTPGTQKLSDPVWSRLSHWRKLGLMSSPPGMSFPVIPGLLPFLLKVSSKPFQTSSPSKVMYITKNLFYSSKSHPYLPPPKTP